MTSLAHRPVHAFTAATRNARDGRPAKLVLGPRFVAFWIVACGLAELVGLAAAAGWWVAMDNLNPDPAGTGARIGMVALKAFAGLVEGGVLGTVQAFAIRRRYPAIDAPAWMVATTILAAAGWAVGSAIPVFGLFGAGAAAGADTSAALVIAGTLLGGALVGAAFGAVQALVLRRVARHAGWWIVGNAAGWAVALPIIYSAASHSGAALGWAGLLSTGLASGLAAGLVIGLATGLTFARMPPR